MSGTRKELRIVVSSLILAAATPLAAFGQDEAAEEPVPNTRENMYRTIVDRNPFGLKPPPPPQPVETPVVKPKTDIKLTGITAFNGQLKAYFMSTPQGAAPGKGAQQQQQQPEYFGLGVDEKKDELEVLGIDYGNRSVRVRAEGVETVFDFEKNGVQAPQVIAPPAPGAHAPPGTPGANTAGGIPGAAPFNNNSGGAPVPGTPPPLNNGNVRPIPSRIPRTPQAQPDNAMIYQGGNAGYIGGNSYGSQPVQQPIESNLTPEQQIILMEAQKAVNPNVQFPPTPGLPGQGGPPIPGGRPLPPLPGR